MSNVQLYIPDTNNRERKLIEHAVEQVSLDEDIWSVVKWLLAALGIKFMRKYADYAVVNAKNIKKNTTSGAAEQALRRALSASDRKKVEVHPEPRKKLIVVRKLLKDPESGELAQKVVDKLIKMGGKTVQH